MFNKRMIILLIFLQSTSEVYCSNYLLQSLDRLSSTLDSLSSSLSSNNITHDPDNIVPKGNYLSYNTSFNYTFGMSEKEFRSLVRWTNGYSNSDVSNDVDKWIRSYQPTQNNYPRAALINNDIINYQSIANQIRVNSKNKGTFRVILQDITKPYTTDSMHLQGADENKHAGFQIDYLPWSREHDMISAQDLLMTPMLANDTQNNASIISTLGFHTFNKYAPQQNKYTWKEVKSKYNKGLPHYIRKYFNPYEKLGVPFCNMVDNSYSYINVDTTALSKQGHSTIDIEGLVDILINPKTIVTIAKDRNLQLVAVPVSYNLKQQKVDTAHSQVITQLLCSSLNIPINNHISNQQNANINQWAQRILTGLYKNTIQACSILGVKKLYLTMLGIQNGTQLDWITQSLQELQNIIKTSNVEILFIYRYAPRSEYYSNTSNQSFVTELLRLQNKINNTSIVQNQWTPQGTAIKEYVEELKTYYQIRYQQKK